MKRILAIALSALVVFMGGAAAAATAMKVTINGKEVSFKTAPKFQDNVLMVPLEEVVSALGIDAKWNVGANTLEVTDKRADLVARLQSDLAQAQKDLADVKSNKAAPTPQITKDNLLSELQKQFAAAKVGDQTLNVTWIGWTSEDKYYLMAKTDSLGRIAYLRMKLAGKDSDLKTWFENACKLIAQAYPTGAVASLVATDTYSDYPTSRWDDVKLTSSLKWQVTEYIIWWFPEIGVQWDSEN